MKAKFIRIAAVNAAILAVGASAFAQTSYDANVSPVKGDGTILNGNNIANGGFKVVQNGTLELGLRAALDHQNTFPDNGNGIYNVPAGPGIDPSRGSWTYTFSISSSALANYTFALLVDSNPSGADTWNSFDPTSIADNVPPGSLTVAQNVENPVFPIVGIPGFDINGNGQYDLELVATDKRTGEVTTDEITINQGDVSAIPDASSTLPLLGAAFAGAALLRRKIKA